MRVRWRQPSDFRTGEHNSERRSTVRVVRRIAGGGVGGGGGRGALRASRGRLRERRVRRARRRRLSPPPTAPASGDGGLALAAPGASLRRQASREGAPATTPTRPAARAARGHSTNPEDSDESRDPGRSRLLFAFAARLTVLPDRRIAVQVNDSEHDGLEPVESVEDAIGKLARDGSSHLSVDDPVLRWVQANAIENSIDLTYERAAEACALPFIPSGGLSDVRLGLAPDDQPVGHRLRRISSRAVSQASTSVGVS
jgi:hypothetical protein